MRQLLLLAAITTAIASAAPTSILADDRPNVLFIAIDDLNHWVGHLGRNAQTQTPNIDRLASEGVAFSRAYCTAPACNPSRASLMSGLRPSTTGCYLNEQNWRSGINEDRLLNSAFARAGYRVYGAGKIYHGAGDRGGVWHDYFPGQGETTRHPDANNGGVNGIRFYPAAESDEEMPDYKVVSYALDKLNEPGDKPFFLAVGLVKPHMPFSVPKKWFDKFPLESVEMPPHREDDLDDIPPAGIKMARRGGDHRKIIASGRWKEAVQAYLATIAFCDSQIGRLLDGLRNSRHANNTIVVLWSDHGWSLGEKEHWRKFALWEEPTRTVFVWRVPGVTPAGQMCERPVDYTCIYPTLCELTGIEPANSLDGTSIIPLLENPSAEWNEPAITTHGRNNHAVRFEDWRYIRYENGDEELYNSVSDPLEYTNLADDPGHADQKAALARMLPKQNAKDLPLRSKFKGKNNRTNRRARDKPRSSSSSLREGRGK